MWVRRCRLLLLFVEVKTVLCFNVDVMLEVFGGSRCGVNLFKELTFLGNRVALVTSEGGLSGNSLLDERDVVMKDARQESGAFGDVIVDGVDSRKELLEFWGFFVHQVLRRNVELVVSFEEVSWSEDVVECGSASSQQQEGAFHRALDHVEKADAASSVVVGGDGILDVHLCGPSSECVANFCKWSFTLEELAVWI